ncbi:methyltransferase [uncultured Ruminococcus sp.]|uniref:tRNA1(Val) (adenine(37)-N6)-methyltransferase n=1 Tax=uncultured Ruminococcus sp. TaxID=165186 RepID=UPI0029301C22|nr:methyltransferase [uncultured Ruminococcus sp.]
MRIEPLGSGIRLYVSDTHHFTTDTILLASFAAVKNGERVVELGTGCGTIPLLLIRDRDPQSIHALEIQEDAISLFRESLRLNLDSGIEKTSCITPILGDLRNIRELLPAGESDLVICNPPYKLPGSGITNPDEAKMTARHESACTLDDICEAARWLLRFGGRFVICQRPERLTDVLSSLRAHELEPKRLRLVQGRVDKAPKLFLCEAKRGAKPGYMDVLPTLIIEDKDGFTEEMKQIYGAYKEGHDG